MRFIQLSLFDRLFNRKTKPRRGTRKQSPPKDEELLKSIWLKLRRSYFPDHADLDKFTVYWSKRRQKRTLASCNLEQKRIAVAQELNQPKHFHWLSPLLYHEMCHASLGENVSKSGKKSFWHGQEFKKLEQRHPEAKNLDLWIKSGGWDTAVRSHRAKSAHLARKIANK